MWRSSTACGYIQEIWLTSATQPRSIAGASLFLRGVMPRSPEGERHAPPRSPLRPPCPRAVMHSKNPLNNLTPNCVTITEPACDRKEPKFSVPRSARIARQDSRLGCRQIPAQAFHDQSVDILKELLRDSDIYLALRIDELREHDNVWIPVSPLPTCSAASRGKKTPPVVGTGRRSRRGGLRAARAPPAQFIRN